MQELKAPACPSWCSQIEHDWTADDHSISKTCSESSVVTRDLDDAAVTVTLERFASLDDRDGIEIEPPAVRIECLGRLAPTAALVLAQSLISAANAALTVAAA